MAADPVDLPASAPAQASAALPASAAAEPAAAISLEAEVPEVLFDGMRQFIAEHPQWDQYRLITSALASFLFQHGCKDACVNQHYLNGLFLR
jgi:hypothetical protein